MSQEKNAPCVSQSPRHLGGTKTPADPRHIILIGFMGAGKTTVGQAVAAKLGLPFIDLDQQVAEKAQKSLPQMFRQAGEIGFRAQERHTLRDVLEAQEPIVLATGGGTYIDPIMRHMLHQCSCALIYLQVDAPTVLRRLNTPEALAGRPMLDGPDSHTAIVRLLEARRDIYAQASLTVTTDDRDVAAVVGEVLAKVAACSPEAASQPTVAHSTDVGCVPIPGVSGPGFNKPFFVQGTQAVDATHYRVEIRLRAGGWLAESIVAACPGLRRVAVITDRNVVALHAQPLAEALAQLGFTVSEHVIDPGEANKSLKTCAELYDALADAQLTREDVLVALGGGVVGDVTGFVASTYLRGLRYVQVPTTTLAAVDASVGAKTAVNTAHGKNLVGTFYPPQSVLVAVSHLATQTRRQHASGLVEALKMAVTLDAPLFTTMQRRMPELLALSAAPLAELIGHAIGHKARVVERDENDRGVRNVLNFGHTFGHAIELGENFRVLHGEAVALGMIAEAQWAESVGLSHGVVQPLKEALSAMNMPVDWRRANLQLGALKCDKKRTGDKVMLPVVPELGCAQLHPVPLDKLVAFATDGTEP